MTCQEFVELVTDYLEASLAADTRRRFEEHISECPGCANYLDQIREVVRQAGRLDGADLSPAARATLLEAFHDWSG